MLTCVCCWCHGKRYILFDCLILQATEREVILMEQQLYSAVTATSSWVDDVENTLFSGPALLTENAETQLSNHEV